MSTDLITPAETVRLCELERIIQKGKDTFVEVGTALAEIRDSLIYRGPNFNTFEDYCETRWGFSKRSAYQFIAAAEVVENVRNCAHLPATESQARPLAKLPAEQQPAAWEKAQEIAKEEGKPVAARHVEAAVAEVMPKTEELEPVVVDGIADPSAMTTKASKLSQEEEKESFALMELKRLWKKAGKKDRQKFIEWAK